MTLIDWRRREKRRGERVFGQVLALGLAAAGGTALLVASCLDRHEGAALSEPSYVETTSAAMPAATPLPSPIIVSAPAEAPAPVNITVNNQLPASTTTTTSADEPGIPAQSPETGPRAPLVDNYTPAPYGATYRGPNPSQDSDPSRQGGAGELGSGGGLATPQTAPTADPTPAPTPQFSTDWGPAGSGYTTPNPTMGAGEFTGGWGPRFPQ